MGQNNSCHNCCGEKRANQLEMPYNNSNFLNQKEKVKNSFKGNLFKEFKEKESEKEEEGKEVKEGKEKKKEKEKETEMENPISKALSKYKLTITKPSQSPSKSKNSTEKVKFNNSNNSNTNFKSFSSNSNSKSNSKIEIIGEVLGEKEPEQEDSNTNNNLNNLNENQDYSSSAYERFKKLKKLNIVNLSENMNFSTTNTKLEIINKVKNMNKVNKIEVSPQKTTTTKNNNSPISSSSNKLEIKDLKDLNILVKLQSFIRASLYRKKFHSKIKVRMKIEYLKLKEYVEETLTPVSIKEIISKVETLNTKYYEEINKENAFIKNFHLSKCLTNLSNITKTNNSSNQSSNDKALGHYTLNQKNFYSQKSFGPYLILYYSDSYLKNKQIVETTTYEVKESGENKDTSSSKKQLVEENLNYLFNSNNMNAISNLAAKIFQNSDSQGKVNKNIKFLSELISINNNNNTNSSNNQNQTQMNKNKIPLNRIILGGFPSPKEENGKNTNGKLQKSPTKMTKMTKTTNYSDKNEKNTLFSNKKNTNAFNEGITNSQTNTNDSNSHEDAGNVGSNINYCISFYYGEVNLRNQRHGKGVLLTNDNRYFDGNWNKNRFEGFGRIIEETGTITEGKK